MKTILLHVQDDDRLDLTFENAVAITEACKGELKCLHAVPSAAYVANEPFGGFAALDDIMAHLDKRATEIRKRIEDDLANENITWEYEHLVNDSIAALVNRAALADLIVTSRTSAPDQLRTSMAKMGELLSRSRTPVFVPGDREEVVDAAGQALIAWDGSYEAANAVRGSLGLLQLADDVRILRVEEKDGGFPDQRLLEYLSRFGVAAELKVVPRDHDDIAKILLREVDEIGKGYMVLGGYSHSRVGEFLFGGVTRTMLKGCPVGLVIAH